MNKIKRAMARMTAGTTAGMAAGITAFAVFAVPALRCAHAETVPEPGRVDRRLREVEYNPAEVYRLRGHAGYQIDLQFEAGETFTGLGAGDVEALAFVAQENHLFLKPRAAEVRTNLTVLTSRRQYQFDYSASQEPPGGEAIYALRFVYPAPSPPAADPVESRLEEARRTRRRNVDYWYAGRASIKPLSVYDDGVHTRLTFAPRTELPAIFARNEDGSESLLNFSMEAGDVIVHRVARRLILRRGALRACIVNKGFGGSGERLDSGTLAPTVTRATPGARP